MKFGSWILIAALVAVRGVAGCGGAMKLMPTPNLYTQGIVRGAGSGPFRPGSSRLSEQYPRLSKVLAPLAPTQPATQQTNTNPPLTSSEVP